MQCPGALSTNFVKGFCTSRPGPYWSSGPWVLHSFLLGFLLWFFFPFLAPLSPSPVHLVGSTCLFITLFLLFSPRRREMDPHVSQLSILVTNNRDSSSAKRKTPFRPQFQAAYKAMVENQGRNMYGEEPLTGREKTPGPYNPRWGMSTATAP